MNALTDAFRYHRQRGLAAGAALAAARDDAAAGKARYLYKPAAWNPATAAGARWVESLPAAGLRFVGWADELANIRHCGWYTDDSYSNVMRGAVLQLSGAKGRARYLAAYADRDADAGSYCVDFSPRAVFEGMARAYEFPAADDDGAREAAYAADSFAEQAAENEREHQDAWSRGSDYAFQGEAIREARRTALALLAERRQLAALAPDAPASCAALVGRVRELLGEIRAARKARAEARDVSGYWEREYGDAFNEAAGETVFNVA